MYALLSSLERDLRDFIISNISPLSTPEGVLGETIEKKARERFHKENPDSSPEDGEILEYIDMGDEIQIIRGNDKFLDDSTRKYIKKYYTALDELIPIRNRVMHSRPLEYDDLSKLLNLTTELVKSHRLFWANLRTTRKLLEKDPEFVTTLSIPEISYETRSLLHNLPQTEFDDTGFLVREKELSELKKAILGNYPIVTVVGEGGLGKTALALKACYDLLDDEDTKLDAIVWTTAKTTRLTLNEIQIIDGAISSSLGIIEDAASILGRENETSAIDDLLSHLTNNKILLVIDNLETVIDQNIRDLVRRIPSGSKILFTTRIGLGAFDFPISLSPLNKKEAAFYFRNVARVWGVTDMAMATQAIVDSYCNKLQYNPLFMKWFIQCIRAGARPATLTNDPALFLRFCLQNVFNSLSRESKLIAGTLASVSGSQSVAGLAYFTDLDSINVQSALSHLITSNLVMSERGRSSEDEDRYLLSPLARLYIQKHIKPSVEEQRKLISKQNSLRSAKEEFSARAGSDTYDMNVVYVRDKDDYIVAKILTRALEYIFKERLDEAEQNIKKAMDLSPNYFEVHRVKAFLHSNQEDYFSAESSYESAISLASEQAPLRLWFAGFLSRQLGDQERALDHLLKAESIAPNSPAIKLECARVFQYQREFDKSAERLSAIRDIDKLPAKTRRIHLDLVLQNYIRKCEHIITKGEFEPALSCLEMARGILDSAPETLIDLRTIRNVGKCRRSLPALKRELKGSNQETRLYDIERWINDLVIEISHNQYENSTRYQTISDVSSGEGRIVQLHSTYGFIDKDHNRIFFHRGEWKDSVEFKTLKEGNLVVFDIGSNFKGPCAINVRFSPNK